MSKLKEVMKYLFKFSTTLTGVMVLGVACVFLLCAVPTIINRLSKPKIPEATTPLEPSVVQHLCQELDMTGDESLCQPGATVYAPDFFPAIRATFVPGVTTYDDVQEKLGRYQYRREPLVTQADGTSYFVCGYDFRGDRVFPVGFFFTDKGVLKRLFATVGDD